MKRLLYISHRVPFPPDKGERVRAFYQLRALAEHFDVTLACLSHNPADDKAIEHLRPICSNILHAPAGTMRTAATGLLVGRCVTRGIFDRAALHRQIATAAQADPFDLIVCYSSSTIVYRDAAGPATPAVMDLVDVDSQKFLDYADRAKWVSRWIYRREARGVRKLEARSLDRCDATLVVTEAERALLADRPGAGKVQVIPNGVDIQHFQPPPAAPAPNDKPELVFTGQMDYRPNVEAVCWFAAEVLPQLQQARPDLRFSIVGRQPAPAVAALGELPGVTVTGRVADVRPYLARADLAVVPLQMARGVQNKILEAMAMARPVVASRLAAAPLGAETGRDLLTAETPGDYKAAIELLLADDDLRRRIGTASRAFVLDRYNWADTLEPFLALCHRLAGQGE
jgi:polysaccharide biosynthesis protein PslH